MLVLTIAVGIGSGATVQGFVRGLLTVHLPIFAIERVVAVFATNDAGASGPLPFEMFAALQARTDVFESLAAIRESQRRVSFGTRTTLMSVAEYSPDASTLFPVGSGDGVTLGQRVRFANFPASIDPAGRTLRLEGSAVRIVGTLPYWLEGLYRGRAIDLWVPMDDSDRRSLEGPVWLVGRLRPGVSHRQAQAAIDEIATKSASIVLLPYTGQTAETASGMRRIGALLQMASLMVFGIVCANVAALLLARSWARAHETALRVAIGARRRQLLRQLLIDSAVISIIGGVAGYILARWMADLVPLMFFDQDAERLVFAPDQRSIAVASLAGIGLTIGSGLLPLFEARDDTPSAILQRETAGRSRTMARISTGLILLQMTGCALLLISTGQLLQSFRAALDTEAGRQLGNPILVTLEALPSPSPDAGRKYFAAALEAAASVTPFSETIWAARLPGLHPTWQWVRFDSPRHEPRELRMPIASLTEEFLDQLVLPPMSGRLFGTYDDGCRTIVLNEAASTTIFDDHPIGRVLGTPNGRDLEVIGVTRLKDGHDTAPFVYDHPNAQAPLGIDGQITLLAPPRGELASGAIDINIVSANYFEAMGLTLSAGSLFDRQACRVGVVNEEAASRYFGGDAIGKAVIDDAGRRTAIVGVVRSALLRSGQRRAEPTLFLPATQDYLARMTAVLSAPSADDRVLEDIRRRIASVQGGRADRLVVTTLDEHLAHTTLAPERIAATLVGTLAAIGVAVGALGLYGLMADAARRRRREFAVRLALGAQSWRVVRLLLVEGMRLVLIGFTVGVIGSIVVARWLSGIVPFSGTPSWRVWLMAPAVLAAAVLLASVVPARRSLSVDLVSLMRDM